MAKTDLGKHVSDRRAELGLDTTQVARRASMSPNFVDFVENEVSVLTMQQLVNLAQALDTTAAALLGAGQNGGHAHRVPGLDGITDPKGAFEAVEMDLAQCHEYLRISQVGRLGVLTADGPMIFPVNYLFDGEIIVFRSDPGTKLAEAPMSRVAFEIDRVDPGPGDPWSVIVKGRAFEITHAMGDLADRLRNHDVSTWLRGDKKNWVAIMPVEITGRQLRRVQS